MITESYRGLAATRMEAYQREGISMHPAQQGCKLLEIIALTLLALADETKRGGAFNNSPYVQS